MTRWEYKITTNDLPEPKSEGPVKTFSCDHEGRCVVHDSVAEGRIALMEKLFNDEGKEGWELVQLEHHQPQLWCIWKRAQH